MQSYMVETVHQPFRNNSFLVCTPGNDFYVNYRGQRSSSAFFYFLSMRCTYKIDHIFNVTYPRPLNMVLFKSTDIALLSNGK